VTAWLITGGCVLAAIVITVVAEVIGRHEDAAYDARLASALAPVPFPAPHTGRGGPADAPGGPWRAAPAGELRLDDAFDLILAEAHARLAILAHRYAYREAVAA
jgi:hypothetical protein